MLWFFVLVVFSTYEINGEKKNMAVTQFEPVDARRCFPCWDEPACKVCQFKTQKLEWVCYFFFINGCLLVFCRLHSRSHWKCQLNLWLFLICRLSRRKWMEIWRRFHIKKRLSCLLIWLQLSLACLIMWKIIHLMVLFFSDLNWFLWLLMFLFWWWDVIKIFTGVKVRVYCQVGKTKQGNFALHVAVKTLELFKGYVLPSLVTFSINWSLAVYGCPVEWLDFKLRE